jgi:hypothetical protein
MSPVLLAPIVALVVVAVAAMIVGRRAAARRRAQEEIHRLRRQELEVDHAQDQDQSFHNWRVEEFAFEHEAKRAEADRASKAADVYAHLAEEQEVRAAELTEESEDAAARAGLEDIRRRRLEAGPD